MSTCSSKRTGDPGGTQLMNTLAACVMKICSTFYIRESFEEIIGQQIEWLVLYTESTWLPAQMPT